MRKLGFLISLSLILLSRVYAQSSTTFQLRGIITDSINISTNISDVVYIDLRRAQTLFLGSISFNTNTNRGYSVTITSQNGGVMRGTSENNDTFPYSLSFGGIENIDLSSEFQIAFNSSTGLIGSEFPVSVNFPTIDTLGDSVAAGIYEDLMFITVSVM